MSMFPPLGCHVSIAGGYHKAVLRGREVGAECIQVFTTPPRIWPSPDPLESDELVAPRIKAISDRDVALFQSALREQGIGATLTHASYLINLASPDDNLWRRSLNSLLVELQRSEQLGIDAVVFHPGSYTSSSTELGIERVAAALNEISDRMGNTSVVCLLESTAGQGTNLGRLFGELAEMLQLLNNPERFGVCLDTCHMFAAGYGLGAEGEYEKTIAELDEQIGIDQVRAIHLNDSKHPCGSRKDRHEHIGKGEMGLEPFRKLLNDERFQSVPMYLETPKGEVDGESWDAINLKTLRDLRV